MKLFISGLAVASLTLCCLAIAETADGADKDAKTKTVAAGDLKLTVPEAWKQTPPTSSMRLAQLEVPAAEGDSEPGEIAIFGAVGGGVDANVKRWIGQFKEDGRKQKIVTGTWSQGKYTLVDLQGTYNKPIGPPVAQKTTPMPGARALNVVLQTDKGENFFIRFTGPAKTVTAAADAFRKSFGGDAATEKEAKAE